MVVFVFGYSDRASAVGAYAQSTAWIGPALANQDVGVVGLPQLDNTREKTGWLLAFAVPNTYAYKVTIEKDGASFVSINYWIEIEL